MPLPEAQAPSRTRRPKRSASWFFSSNCPPSPIHSWAAVHGDHQYQQSAQHRLDVTWGQATRNPDTSHFRSVSHPRPTRQLPTTRVRSVRDSRKHAASWGSRWLDISPRAAANHLLPGIKGVLFGRTGRISRCRLMRIPPPTRRETPSTSRAGTRKQRWQAATEPSMRRPRSPTHCGVPRR